MSGSGFEAAHAHSNETAIDDPLREVVTRVIIEKSNGHQVVIEDSGELGGMVLVEALENDLSATIVQINVYDRTMLAAINAPVTFEVANS